MSFVLAAIVILLSIIFPGFFLSMALLKKTKLNMFEIIVIGFIFGMIFPPTMTWLEGYFINYIHSFAFSAGLYEANVIILTIIGIALCFAQGIFSSENVTRLQNVLGSLTNIDNIGAGLKEKKKKYSALIWSLLLLFMVVAFLTRIASIGIAPHFFEFDPYFDMLSTESILVHGYQVFHDHSAWPTLIAGAPHRIEPLMPYIEAFWYSVAESAGSSSSSTVNITLLSQVSSFYPPITAALLVFVIFMFLYHEYGEFPAIIGAALVTGMPTLISTFIAGEQLLEPWGIFSLFFFFAAYLVAVNNPKERRFAVLAGIAFASTFLGAHYYTVDAGVLGLYIVIQGILKVFGFSGKDESMADFYITNGIIVAVIAAFFLIFSPYGTVLSNRSLSVAGIPLTIATGLFALIFVFVFQTIPVYLARNKIIITKIDNRTYFGWLVFLLVVVILLIAFTKLGTPVKSYIALTEHFTTASTPLFATVQEYAPTGVNFNFGSGGFGIIGWAITYGTNSSLNLLIFLILGAFAVLAVLAIIYRHSNASVLGLTIIFPLAVAGMLEVKYLPHFGVAYILAIGIIIGELLILAEGGLSSHEKVKHAFDINFSNISFSNKKLIIAVIAIIVAIAELGSIGAIFSAAINPNCNTLANQGNSLGYNLFCETVPSYWIAATAWMRQNVGPYGPRILSWWDYGDWINWFGNSNAVLRGDNAVPTLDYATAAQYVLGTKDNVSPRTLATFMNSMQAKYVLFDNQLMQKWGALNFLACIDTNQTTLGFANQQGRIGNSTCEQVHSPVYAFVPLASSGAASIADYCQFKNTSISALHAILLGPNSTTYQNYCVPSTVLNSGSPVTLYNASGNRTNMVIVPTQEFFYGVANLGGQPFAEFFVLYLPNGPNNTITDAPSEFYNSNYYKGFFFGKLPGFKLVYPSNFTGINYINSTNPIMIYAVDNYTGGSPPVTPKYPFITNNYTMPG
jgi:asparagine N-glycosylation enzyme membrane subunit Stt3